MVHFCDSNAEALGDARLPGAGVASVKALSIETKMKRAKEALNAIKFDLNRATFVMECIAGERPDVVVPSHLFSRSVLEVHNHASRSRVPVSLYTGRKEVGAVLKKLGVIQSMVVGLRDKAEHARRKRASSILKQQGHLRRSNKQSG